MLVGALPMSILPSIWGTCHPKYTIYVQACTHIRYIAWNSNWRLHMLQPHVHTGIEVFRTSRTRTTYFRDQLRKTLARSSSNDWSTLSLKNFPHSGNIVLHSLTLPSEHWLLWHSDIFNVHVSDLHLFCLSQPYFRHQRCQPVKRSWENWWN